MRGRLLLAKWGVVFGTGITLAQSPPLPQAPLPPTYPGPIAPKLPPGQLPPLRPASPVLPPPGFPAGNAPGLTLPAPGIYPPGSFTPNPIAQAQEIPLPQKENRIAINAADVNVKRVAGAWQLWVGQKLLRDFGNADKSEANAYDAARVYRDLRPTEWATIGGPKPVVEYGLVNGRPPMTPGIPGAAQAERSDVFQSGGNTSGPAITGAGAKAIIPIDLKTVRVEAVRGVWCVRDDSNIHFNFGPNKPDADQALAVIQRYGFNRVGVVGEPTPAMNYLFASPDDGAAPSQGPFAKVQLQAQIDGLTRVGIPVGGVGYVGEMIKFDPRKLDVRKDGAEWVITSGTEVIGRYGPTEWVARDAARTIQDSRFTEFCKVGSAGLTFFLVDGMAPTRVPYATQGRRFDLNALKVHKVGEKWAVTENARHLLDCANQEEGETLIRVLKHYQFDQLCHLGPTPKLGVSFLAKGK